MVIGEELVLVIVFVEYINGGIMNGKNGNLYVYDFMQVDLFVFCISSSFGGVDLLNWVKMVKVMEGSYLDEVKGFVKMFMESKFVLLEGVSFIVVYVVVVVWCFEVQVVLDVVMVKQCVDESFNWVLQKIMCGLDIYGVIMGFGVMFYCCIQQGVEF